MSRIAFVVCLFALFSMALLLAATNSSWAATAAPPDIQAIRVDEPPAIDGLLEDPCWEQAARAEGFFCLEVEGNRPSPEVTVALLCYDETALYVAVICDDRTPGDIAANETQRGGDVDNDDSIRLRLDPWHTHGESDCYEFFVNACGTQAEEIPGGSASKIEWRGDWEAAATRTPTGWQAEMAIPFSILRYSADQEEFGIAVTRRT